MLVSLQELPLQNSAVVPTMLSPLQMCGHLRNQCTTEDYNAHPRGSKPTTGNHPLKCIADLNGLCTHSSKEANGVVRADRYAIMATLSYDPSELLIQFAIPTYS
jgi:hypothetical protein